jgi:ubiquinone/menaquinone biosynthesis C-methylase UbiE
MITDTNKILETERKSVVIEPVNMIKGHRILDIGGGGEGVISSIYKDKVVAIDIRADELEEISEPSSLKIVMDATQLAFIDNQFERATAFFSFMYMNASEIIKVIEEVHRVLKSGGTFEIWDLEMPSINDVKADIFIAQLEIKANEHSISTGYGVRIKEQQQTMHQLSALLVDCGFKLTKSILHENDTFYIEAKK